MENINYNDNAQINLEPIADDGDRRSIDRRRESKEGFAYVSTVGWICRREQLRRKDDDSCDWSY